MTLDINFDQPEFLITQIKNTLSFYDPVCVDKQGGFFHFFTDNGDIYDPDTRHLVSATRFVFNYASAAIFFNSAKYQQLARHGLKDIQRRHYNKVTGGYFWICHQERVIDSSNQAYGLAFVLLANAVAFKAKIEESLTTINALWEHLEEYFWEPEFGLYRDALDAELKPLSNYHGQNANMHLCEAMIATFEATGDTKFLIRACTIAESIQKLSQQSPPFIWEHFDENWQIDWHYNKDNPRHLFKPWGFQPGHQIEWAKLLLILNSYHATPSYIELAKKLFDQSISIAWDKKNRGIFYGFSPERIICDPDKYFWVQAEAIATSALLAKNMNTSAQKTHYWEWYHQLWQYVWEHFIDHKHGAWYRILKSNNQKYDNLKSPAGKTDYHNMGACYEVLKCLGTHTEQQYFDKVTNHQPSIRGVTL